MEFIPPPRGEGRLHLAFATSESLESQGWGDSPRQTRSMHAEEAPPNPAALDRYAHKLRFPPHAGEGWIGASGGREWDQN